MTNLDARGISLIGRGAYADSLTTAISRRAGQIRQTERIRRLILGEVVTLLLPVQDQLGNDERAYVEDCTIAAGTNAGNGFFDAYDGAQFVVRTFFLSGNAPSGGHGADSGFFSMRSAEVYNNIFTNGGGILALQFRGGTTMIFSNQFYGSWRCH